MFDIEQVRAIDLDEINQSLAVSSGIADVSLTVEVRGCMDADALERLHGLLAGLSSTRNTVVIDLYEAVCRTGALMRMLRAFRDRRLEAGLACRLRGLHSGVIPEPEAIDLQDLFVAYREARESNNGNREPRLEDTDDLRPNVPETLARFRHLRTSD